MAQTSPLLPMKTRRPGSPRLTSANDPDTGQTTSPARKRLGLAIRCLGLVVCAWALVRFVDIETVRLHITAVTWPTLAVMVILHAVIILLAAWRFAIIAKARGAQIKLTDSNTLTFGSTLANMLLPTGLAGDAGRVLLIRRYGLTLRSATGIGVFDRVIGLASLSLLVLVGSLVDPTLVPLWVLVPICLLSLAILAVLSAPNGWFGRTARSDDQTASGIRRAVPLAGGLSLVAHLISILIASVFLWDQGHAVSVAELLVLFPAVLLAASLPVSIGGWGAREVAAAAAFSAIGLAAPVAVALAFLFGLTQLIAAGLGTAVCWIMTQRGDTRT